MTDQVPSKDLLPCPFCRSAVQFCSDATHECHYIVCSGCEAVVDMSLGTSDDIELLADLRAACIEKWNRRAAPEPSSDLCKQLRALTAGNRLLGYTAAEEIERLERELAGFKPMTQEELIAHAVTATREPPHCSSCSCHMPSSEPAREYPDPVTAFENLAKALPPGFEFPTMEADTSPLTHQEIFSAVFHHANEIVRLTACVPAACTSQPPRDGQ